MWREEKPRALLVGIQTGATTVENSMKLTPKIKNGTALRLSDSSSGYIPKETWNTDLTEYMHPDVHCSVIYTSQDSEAAQVSISRWMDKKASVHLHNGILSGCKKEGNEGAGRRWLQRMHIQRCPDCSGSLGNYLQGHQAPKGNKNFTSASCWKPFYLRKRF